MGRPGTAALTRVFGERRLPMYATPLTESYVKLFAGAAHLPQREWRIASFPDR
jgi:hypothetical protein